ncbi:hypothetical protein [Acinetobacter gerneri]|jgi:hypothetical protein|uniref:Lipoprotein n=2 Tax=Acinetobacter gerneri TaxID=202952 RepID=N8YB05_9GAMM|nr:hypothetical protein [Acinetobacter gerneri]ENV33831.1 hypothetical protein F960_02217 [Acinetobacter gerneri DSM 14967 = CIP 107464 = MTCC 9824]EPR83991.1 hypothetical protein L289_1766 [Acinetobacter gerneri DSM 14967 = CIP 107464 = MTCC 9824]MCH4243488.1 hypothetical protein [Acinetobacter gerneri]MDQ9008769.1 hypothetical protein [Acinetobacter gerneri]MDQ9012683.1 hypothetical protein [Acinetobacter gerneri]
MLNKLILSLAVVASLTACSTIDSSQKYQKPQHLLFINKEVNSLPLQVSRDDKLCNDDKKDDQNCPIKFYIDDFKAGDFYINNKITYYLKPNEYSLTVKNCNTKCDIYHTKININDTFQNVTLVLSIDENGKPFIINKN